MWGLCWFMVQMSFVKTFFVRLWMAVGSKRLLGSIEPYFIMHTQNSKRLLANHIEFDFNLSFPLISVTWFFFRKFICYLLFTLIPDYICSTGSKLYNGACYWLSLTKQPFSEARQQCEQRPAGHLAAIHSQRDYDTLRDFIWFEITLYQITVVYGGRHFDRCSVSPEMFVWLLLIDPVMVDWTGARGLSVLVFIKCSPSYLSATLPILQ